MNISEGESMRRDRRVVKLDESGVRELVQEMLAEMGSYGRMSRREFYGGSRYGDDRGASDEIYGKHDKMGVKVMPHEQRESLALDAVAAMLGLEDPEQMRTEFQDWYASQSSLGKTGPPKELAQRFVKDTQSMPPANEGAVKLDEAGLRRLVRGMLRDAR